MQRHNNFKINTFDGEFISCNKRANKSVKTSLGNACFAWLVIVALHPAKSNTNWFEPDDTRVRDDCHLTGRYRDPAHSNCNLNYKDSRSIPVIFYNLSGYDTHFIIKEIATPYESRISLLPIRKKKYISFTKDVDSTKNDLENCVQLRFINLYKFLASSLEKLSSFLSKNKLRILQREFCNLSQENFNLLTRKGVQYEYIDCNEKLDEMCLPNRELFYSSLINDTVSEDDYVHAVHMWQRFSIRTLGEYSDL
ncbi:hypothetical protein ALC57_09882 [Trachymyrmex cornetzi]|uniref:DNA-directed DNA polymerase n=1 Tax=Trachymyrmex cornetzi TaxID=471704 RepID=A0A151J4Z2_9HYME|nr:hypothetical protein ALC57_09882 [Trachymyrmex cornetzi]